MRKKRFEHVFIRERRPATKQAGQGCEGGASYRRRVSAELETSCVRVGYEKNRNYSPKYEGTHSLGGGGRYRKSLSRGVHEEGRKTCPDKAMARGRQRKLEEEKWLFEIRLHWNSWGGG